MSWALVLDRLSWQYHMLGVNCITTHASDYTPDEHGEDRGEKGINDKRPPISHRITILSTSSLASVHVSKFFLAQSR